MHKQLRVTLIPVLRNIMSGLAFRSSRSTSSVSCAHARLVVAMIDQTHRTVRVIRVMLRLTANQCLWPSSLYFRLVRISVVVSAIVKIAWKRKRNVWCHFKYTSAIVVMAVELPVITYAPDCQRKI